MSNGSSEWAFLGYLSAVCQVLWDLTRCSEPAAATQFYSTLATAAPVGFTSHSTPDVGSPPDLGSFSKQLMLSFTNRCYIRLTNQIVSFCPLIVCTVTDRMTHMCSDLSTLESIIISMHRLGLIDRRGITYRQMNTVIANWLLVHVLNTMFCG